MKTFNEFQREINKRINDKQTAYLLTYMYESIIELNRQMDQYAEIVLQQATALQNLTDFRAGDIEKLEKIRRKVDGVEVASVANDPDDV